MSLGNLIAKFLGPDDIPFIQEKLRGQLEKAVPDIVQGMRKTKYDFMNVDFEEKLVRMTASCECEPNIEDKFTSAEDLKEKNHYGLDLSAVDPSMMEIVCNSFAMAYHEPTQKFKAVFNLKFGKFELEYDVKPEQNGKWSQ